ncbi:MAG: diacylglycerol kinase family protein, partial [Rikenellaceae bacterium]
MKKALFLYNNADEKAKIERQAESIEAILREGGYDTQRCTIDFKGDQIEGREDLDLVVIAGGDGSVNYIVNLMKQCGSKAAIGIIPAGTANDFAHTLGMSSNSIKAARQIAHGVVDHVDCGYVNGLYFV